MWKEDFNSFEAADPIQRFLDGESAYPQEWNDVVETTQRNRQIEEIRKQSCVRDPLVNCPGEPDARAAAEWQSIVAELKLRELGLRVGRQAA